MAYSKIKGDDVGLDYVLQMRQVDCAVSVTDTVCAAARTTNCVDIAMSSDYV